MRAKRVVGSPYPRSAPSSGVGESWGRDVGQPRVEPWAWLGPLLVFTRPSLRLSAQVMRLKIPPPVPAVHWLDTREAILAKHKTLLADNAHRENIVSPDVAHLFHTVKY